MPSRGSGSAAAPTRPCRAGRRGRGRARRWAACSRSRRRTRRPPAQGPPVRPMSGGRLARRERIRAARSLIVPGTAPLRSSGTRTLKQRRGSGDGTRAAAADGAADIAASAATTNSNEVVGRSTSRCSTYRRADGPTDRSRAACRSASSWRWRTSRDDGRSSAASPAALTLPQLVGQHMVFAYDGLAPPQGLRRRIARGEAAGVILFARNVRSAGQVRDVVRGLQAIERPRWPARAAARHGRPGGRAGAAHPGRALAGSGSGAQRG